MLDSVSDHTDRTTALKAGRRLHCVPWVRNLPQYFVQVVHKLDKVRQAFDMFPQRVGLGWSVALPSQLDGPHERCHGLRVHRTEANVLRL